MYYSSQDSWISAVRPKWVRCNKHIEVSRVDGNHLRSKADLPFRKNFWIPTLFGNGGSKNVLDAMFFLTLSPPCNIKWGKYIFLPQVGNFGRCHGLSCHCVVYLSNNWFLTRGTDALLCGTDSLFVHACLKVTKHRIQLLSFLWLLHQAAFLSIPDL